MRTNTTIQIYRVAKAYNGALTEEYVGEFAVWLEQAAQYVWKSVGGSPLKLEVGKGFVAMTDEIDLSSCYFIWDEVRYEVANPEVYRNHRGDFHHAEFIYK